MRSPTHRTFMTYMTSKFGSRIERRHLTRHRIAMFHLIPPSAGIVQSKQGPVPRVRLPLSRVGAAPTPTGRLPTEFCRHLQWIRQRSRSRDSRMSEIPCTATYRTHRARSSRNDQSVNLRSTIDVRVRSEPEIWPPPTNFVSEASNPHSDRDQTGNAG